MLRWSKGQTRSQDNTAKTVSHVLTQQNLKPTGKFTKSLRDRILTPGSINKIMTKSNKLSLIISSLNRLLPPLFLFTKYLELELGGGALKFPSFHLETPIECHTWKRKGWPVPPDTPGGENGLEDWIWGFKSQAHLLAAVWHPAQKASLASV